MKEDLITPLKAKAIFVLKNTNIFNNRDESEIKIIIDEAMEDKQKMKELLISIFLKFNSM